MLQSQQHRLLAQYDVVLCTDADEIVAPDPRSGTLGDYIDRFEGDFVTCRGYEILHLRDREAPLDLWRPILEQRGHWYFNPAYSKPLLARVPMTWHGGLHSCADGQVRDDPSLHLIHLHRVDYDFCLARHKQRASRAWNRRDLDEGWGIRTGSSIRKASNDGSTTIAAPGFPSRSSASPRTGRASSRAGSNPGSYVPAATLPSVGGQRLGRRAAPCSSTVRQHQRVRALAGAEHVYQPTFFQVGDGGHRDAGLHD
jgi:hypothetical protein